MELLEQMYVKRDIVEKAKDYLDELKFRHLTNVKIIWDNDKLKFEDKSNGRVVAFEVPVINIFNACAGLENDNEEQVKETVNKYLVECYFNAYIKL